MCRNWSVFLNTRNCLYSHIRTVGTDAFTHTVIVLVMTAKWLYLLGLVNNQG